MELCKECHRIIPAEDPNNMHIMFHKTENPKQKRLYEYQEYNYINVLFNFATTIVEEHRKLLVMISTS